MIELSAAESDEFLQLPLVATLATYRRDGTVLLSPVWHEWREGAIQVLLGRDDVKANHIRNNTYVGICIYEHAPPYRGIEASGEAVLLEDQYPAALERMAERYLPSGLPGQLARDGLVMRVEPQRLRAWSFADWFVVGH